MKQEYKGFYEKFGLNVVYYRKRKRLTQMKLAELADIDRSHISAIELGNVGVSFDVIFKLCEVLEITPKELFDFRDSNKKRGCCFHSATAPKIMQMSTPCRCRGGYHPPAGDY